MPFSKKIQIANDGSKSILTSGYSKTVFYICLYLKAWLVEPSDVGTTVNTSLVDVYVLFSFFFVLLMNTCMLCQYHLFKVAIFMILV